MNPRQPSGPGRANRGRWPPEQPRYEQFEEGEEGNMNMTMADVQNNGSMLDYLQHQAPRAPAAPRTFSPPRSSQPQTPTQTQSQSQSKSQSQTPSPSQYQFQFQLAPPPVSQPNIATLPPPSIPDKIVLDYPRPKRRNPNDGRQSKPDRRLLNTDPTMWWNDPAQYRTNPSSDKCWQCLKYRVSSKCDLEETGYPCSRCREVGWGNVCRNGLPSKAWEVGMLERKLRRGVGEGEVWNSGNSGYAAPIVVETTEQVKRRMGMGKKKRGRDDVDDDDEDGDGDQDREMPRRPKIRRRNDPNDLDEDGNSPPPQDPRRSGIRIGGNSSLCDRCNRRSLICSEQRPCLSCISVGEQCTDSRTDQTYNAGGSTLRYNVPYNNADAPPLFPPDGNSNVYQAPKEPPLEHDPWAALLDDSGHFIDDLASVEDLAQSPYAGQENDPLPMDMELDLSRPDIIPPRAWQTAAAYEDQIDRRIEELLVASQSWPAVEPAIRASPEVSTNYFEGLDPDQGQGQAEQSAPRAARESPRLPAEYFKGLDQRAASRLPLNVDPFDPTETYDMDAFVNSAPAPAPDPRMDPEYLEALGRVEKRRKLQAYQEYRRNNPRQAPAAAAFSPFQPQAASLGQGPTGPAASVPAPAPRVLGRVPGITARMLNPNAPPPPANLAPFQPRRPQPPAAAPAYDIGKFATWSWDGSGTVNGPSPWPFTKISPSRRVNPGRFGVYEGMINDGRCDEVPRDVAFPDIGANPTHEPGRAKCGDSPVKDCACVEVAQREHSADPFRTCLECYTARLQRVENRAANVERRKIFLCASCAGVAVAVALNGGSLDVQAECLCQTTILNTWLCHRHGNEAEAEFVAALADAEAYLTGVMADGRCVGCYHALEDPNSGVFSCKVCRDWVFANPAAAVGPGR